MILVPLLALCAGIVLPLSMASQQPGAEHAPVSRRLALIRGPGIPPRGLWAFDISWIDQATERYYLADATNARIDIINARTATFEGAIGGFTGFHGSLSTQGPAGLLTDDRGQLWVGDGNSTVKVINLVRRSIVATIKTGGRNRADELAYDPLDELVLVTNGSDTPPFVTFLSVKKRVVVGRLAFPADTAGLEAPLWDGALHTFLLAVPATRRLPGGAITVIDPATRSVVATYTLPQCSPSGLALGPHQDVLVGCNAQPLILDALTGKIEATITAVNGCDEVWFNLGERRYYLAAFLNRSGPVIAVSRTWLMNIPTTRKAHSVAVDQATHHIFVPLSGMGIGVYVIA
jgi:DNA-binding beta-propeller fold protein YncE